MRIVRAIKFLLIFSGFFFTETGQYMYAQAPSMISADTAFRLIVVDPGHFHAALLQKFAYPQVSTEVFVYAPPGPDLEAYLSLVDRYNQRPDSPTHWVEHVYTGKDFLQKMVSEKRGNVLVLAGNNQKKATYLKAGVDAGLNVLIDKPMMIEPETFPALKLVFEEAERKKIRIYDIMTERYEISNRLQKELSEVPALFGTLLQGTADDPAVIEESTHYFYKTVSGSPLVRPAWFYDIRQQGEGLADVTSHLVDLIQWSCFPEQLLNGPRDVRMLTATRWPTLLSLEQFSRSTGQKIFPDDLRGAVQRDTLHVYANGEMHYTLKGIQAKVSVRWDFEAEPGSGDTQYALLRGSLASLVIRQDKTTRFQPALFIEPVHGKDSSYRQHLLDYFEGPMKNKYPGVTLKAAGNGWEVMIPDHYRLGHEAHFAEVTKTFLRYLRTGQFPEWEKSFMLTKYYTLAQAIQMARRH
jgi:predicted dehydrogenase